MLGISRTPITIGELDQRVELQRRTDTPDDPSGGLTETYTPLATVWAKVEAVAGSLYFASMQVEETSTHAITIRIRADWQQIEYFEWSGRRFRVERVRDLDATFQEFLCQEIEAV